MPIVSKKSDSITARIAAAMPSPTRARRDTPKLKFPKRPKSGVPTDFRGVRRCRSARSVECPNPWFRMIAKTVVARIPIRSPPRIFRATSAAVSASPTTNVRISRVERSGPSVTTVPRPATTMPPLTRPMIVMNRPMPIPIARFRSMGMALRTASRNPVSTSTVMMRPSIEDHAHRLRPREPEPADQRERDERVEAEAGGERERVVRVDAHREGHDAGDQRGHREDLRGTPACVPSLSLTAPRIAGFTNRM